MVYGIVAFFAVYQVLVIGALSDARSKKRWKSLVELNVNRACYHQLVHRTTFFFNNCHMSVHKITVSRLFFPVSDL